MFKGVFNSKLKPLYTGFVYSITLSKYRIGIKFDKVPLALEQQQLPEQNCTKEW